MAEIRFTVEVNEEEDGSYWAEVKELPGCFASGFSMSELREATHEAIQMSLPDGVVLAPTPTWRLIKEDPRRSGQRDKAKSGKKKPSAKRKMLVCA
jgi:predicted RNase H-like HicB family nuclease